MIKELVSQSKLYNKNSPKFIYGFFGIDSSLVNIKKIDRDKVYKFNYLAKKKKAKAEENEIYKILTPSQKKGKRTEKYLNYKKGESKVEYSRPVDYNKSDYRMLTVFNDEYKWIKKFQKKFHREIVKTLDPSKLPYLQSTIKTVSYATNANEHKGNKHAFLLDMENFFTQIDAERVKQTLMDLLKLNDDIAEIYATLLTSPSDEPPHNDGRYIIGQGLPSSPLLAFLCNYSFFEYLYQQCILMNIKMTIYVDDISFSSDNPIPQEFINRLFMLFKKNGLSINRKKVARVKNDRIKRITGGFVSKDYVRVKNSKREEIHVLYNEIIDKINKMSSFEDYLIVYNLYLKFTGNYYHIAEVEFKINGNYVVPMRYSKFHALIKNVDSFFPRGINKKNNKEPYEVSNIYKDDLAKFNSCYQMLLLHKEKLI